MYREYLDNHTRYSYLQSDIFSDLPFQWSLSFVETNYCIGMHQQDFFEINIVLKGSGFHYIGNQRIPAEWGDVFFIPPNMPHGYASMGDLDIFHLLLHENFMRRYTSELQSLPFYFTLFNIEPVMRIGGNLQLYLKVREDDFHRIDYLLEHMINWKMRDSEQAIMRNSCALMVLTQLCAIYSEHYPHQTLLHENQYDLDFMKSISEIYENYSHKLTIKHLSEIAHQSRNSYINTFKRIMHTTPADFILRYRLKQAKELLAQSDLIISEIAQLTGFHDAPHFERTFKKAEGCSPAAYRKNKRPIL